MLTWSSLDANPRTRLFGLAYLGAAAVCLGLVGLTALRWPLRTAARHHAADDRPQEAGGFALLMVLLLLAVLSGAVLHVTLWLGAQTRRNASARAMAALRLAATEATFEGLRQLAAAPGPAWPLEERTPSGIATQVGARELPQAEWPAILRGLPATPGLRVQELVTRAADDDRVYAVAALLAVPARGPCRVLAWVENP
jgi:hypothetical protein